MRERLHRRLEDVTGVPAPSWLATLQGPTVEMSEAEVAGLWSTAPASARNHLYLHVPFCKSICSFCNYERLRPSSPDQLTAYAEQVLASIDVLAPATQHLTFHSVYIGGGTPSVLPARLLDQLLTRIDDAFTWHPRAGRHVELDPQVIGASRVQVLVDHGFHHFSFGIQTLDQAINARHNRGPQDRRAVRRCLDLLRGVGTVHCDFLLGLRGTTPAGILAEVDDLLSGPNGPDSIDLYELLPTATYLAAEFGGDRDRFEAHMVPFRTEVDAPLRELVARHGWRVQGQGRHSYKLSGPNERLEAPRYGYTQLVHIEGHPINLLGLGPSARSRVFGAAALTARRAPTGHRYVGTTRGLAGEVQIYLAHVLRDADEVSFRTLSALFGPEVREVMALPIAAWRALELATVDEHTIRMAPMRTPARARALLWLVATEDIEHELARRQALPIEDAVAVARVPGPWQIAHRAGCRLTLERDAAKVVLRLAPSLDDASMRWVLEEGAEHASDPELRRAVRSLRRSLPPVSPRIGGVGPG